MAEPTDHELLHAFARTGDEAAFAALVQRHVNLVWSAALRFTGDDALAGEITQAVFIILARKAGGIPKKVVLTGWLYQTARLTAANALKENLRRQQREHQAYMESTLHQPDAGEAWQQIAPVLDDAMNALRAADRDAVLLRYFENKPLAEVGAALGVSEDAARVRVNRALDKLRSLLAKQGVTLGATAIAGAVAANSVQAAPTGLAVTVAAAKGATVAASITALVKGTISLMTWAKAKVTIAIGTAVIIAAGTTAVALNWEQDIRKLEKNPPVLVLRPTQFPNGGGSAGWSKSGSTTIKQMAVNASIQSLIDSAYSFVETRTVFPENLPQKHFDLMITMATNRPDLLLQEEIKRQFGLVAHREIRETNVLSLKFHHTNAPGLQISKGGRFLVNGWATNYLNSWTTSWTVSNQTFTGYARLLEQYVGKPITNRIDLTGKYNFHLKWKYFVLKADRWSAADSKSFQKSLAQALRDQLGLELVPSREPIEMLVVEKVK